MKLIYPTSATGISVEDFEAEVLARHNSFDFERIDVLTEVALSEFKKLHYLQTALNVMDEKIAAIIQKTPTKKIVFKRKELVEYLALRLTFKRYELYAAVIVHQMLYDIRTTKKQNFLDDVRRYVDENITPYSNNVRHGIILTNLTAQRIISDFGSTLLGLSDNEYALRGLRPSLVILDSNLFEDSYHEHMQNAHWGLHRNNGFIIECNI